MKITLIFAVALALCILTQICRSKRVAMIEVTRHGARAPFAMYGLAVNPNEEFLMPRALTNLGVKQQYLLGIELHKRLIDEDHYLHKYYHADEIKIFSTFWERSLVSAQAQMLGLYPPGRGGQLLCPHQEEDVEPPFYIQDKEKIKAKLCEDPLPYGHVPPSISTLSPKMNHMLILHAAGTCPAWDRMSKAIMNKPENVKALKRIRHALFPLISKSLNISEHKITDLMVDDFVGYIESMYEQNTSMKVKVTKKEIRLVQQLGDIRLQWLTSGLPEISKLGSTHFFTLVLDYFNAYIRHKKFEVYWDKDSIAQRILVQRSHIFESSKKINQKSKDKFPKLLLFSAHDTTIIMFINGLGITHNRRAPVSASFFLELIQDDNDHSKFMINVIYNDEYLKLPGCKTAVNCDYKDFEAHLRKQLHKGNVMEFCHSKHGEDEYLHNLRVFDNPKDKEDRGIMGWFMAVIFIPILVLMFADFYYLSRRQSVPIEGSHRDD